MNVKKLPVPDLDPQPVTMEEYFTLVPEKLEFVNGFLIDPKERPAARRRLFALLLRNLGLVEAVKLAPPERWKEALRIVYGEDP